MFSHEILIPSKDMETVFNNVLSWVRKRWIPIDTIESNIVKLRIRTKAESKYSDVWIMEIQTSREINGIKIKIRLIERLKFLGNPSKKKDEIPSRLPFMIRSLYKHLGLELNDNRMRIIFSKSYLEKNIQHTQRWIVLWGVILGILGIYGSTKDTYLPYMIIAMGPVGMIIRKVEEITVLKSLSQRLYGL